MDQVNALKTWCNVYIKSAESMEEVKDSSIQLAVTSLADRHIVPPPEERGRGPDESKDLILGRILLIRNLYPYLASRMREVWRVLKDDGLFFLNIGSPVRYWKMSAFSVIWPYYVSEYIILESPLQLRRVFVMAPDKIYGAVPEEIENRMISVHEFFFMFSKGDNWKMNLEEGIYLPSILPYSRDPEPIIEKYRSTGVSLSTPFARDVIREILATFTEKGDTVLDPCAGIGTLAVEANKLGRNAILYEIDKKLVPVIEEFVRNPETELAISQTDP